MAIVCTTNDVMEYFKDDKPEKRYTILSGEAFNYRLVKLKIKFRNRFRSKTIWVFEPLENNDMSYRSKLSDNDYIALLRAKGLNKTHVEPYIITSRDVSEIRVIKSRNLYSDQAFALKKYFTERRNYELKHRLYYHAIKNYKMDTFEVESSFIQDYLKATKIDYMRQEVFQWLETEKKIENDE